MVSCIVSYNGVSKPFFMNPQKTKVTGPYFTKHLEKDLLSECRRMYPDDNYIFQQDGATSHTSLVCQSKLRQLLRKRFINKDQWPPKSPDLNPLDYYFWEVIKTEVYKNRSEPFQNLAQLSRRIRIVWQRAINMEHVRKAIDQFRPRCQKVVECRGYPIKQYFK